LNKIADICYRKIKMFSTSYNNEYVVQEIALLNL